MDLRLVYTFAILPVIFYATFADSVGDKRPCDPKECNTECISGMGFDNGICLEDPSGYRDKESGQYQSCYCRHSTRHLRNDSMTKATWCVDNEHASKCMPVFIRGAPFRGDIVECGYSCSHLFGGGNWIEACGLRTDFKRCQKGSLDFRCIPEFDADTPSCNYSDCLASCRSNYEGLIWKEVRGFCQLDGFCQCYGKPVLPWFGNSEQVLN